MERRTGQTVATVAARVAPWRQGVHAPWRQTVHNARQGSVAVSDGHIAQCLPGRILRIQPRLLPRWTGSRRCSAYTVRQFPSRSSSVFVHLFFPFLFQREHAFLRRRRALGSCSAVAASSFHALSPGFTCRFQVAGLKTSPTRPRSWRGLASSPRLTGGVWFAFAATFRTQLFVFSCKGLTEIPAYLFRLGHITQLYLLCVSVFLPAVLPCHALCALLLRGRRVQPQRAGVAP